MEVIEQSERRCRHSFVAHADVALRGTTLTLWSKNTMKHYRFRNARHALAHDAILAERNTVPDYFSKVILPAAAVQAQEKNNG
jgi:hypothetical protein